MTQLDLGFKATQVSTYTENHLKKYFFSDKFIVTSVYDIVTDCQQNALRYDFDWPEIPIKISFNIIPNANFTALGYLYLNTVSESAADLISSAHKNYANGAKLEIMCYMSFSNELLIKDVDKNLKLIISSYYINDTVLRNNPSHNTELPDWLKFDPISGMFFIKSSFVLRIEHDYTNTPTCYYRTDCNGRDPSSLYKYANRATSNICSNKSLEDAAAKQNSIAQCKFPNFGSITVCPFYKEDKFKLLTTEFYSEHDENRIIRKVECHLIREIINESYILLFEEVDTVSNDRSLLKRFSYGDTLVGKVDQKDQLIAEAIKQNAFLVSDYIPDYQHRVINHVQSAAELTQNQEVETKVSYLSKLAFQS
jgi:hypothetical protein